MLLTRHYNRVIEYSFLLKQGSFPKEYLQFQFLSLTKNSSESFQLSADLH